jgi:hypothetical protein
MLDRMKTPLSLASASAGLMYLFDPAFGRRRRALLRDKLTHAGKQFRKGADVTLRDVGHRLYGAACELRAKLRGRDASDEVVVDRVRSKLGRYVSHPSSIEVHVCDGCVALSGPILAAEVPRLVRALKAVDGVRGIKNMLEVHSTCENVSALQGGHRRTGEPLGWMQCNWSPSARALAGATGALLMVNCLAKRSPSAIALGTAGSLLFLRAVTNHPILGALHGGARGAINERQMKTSDKASTTAPAGSNTPQVHFDRAKKPSSPIQPMYAPLDDDELIDEASMESFPASDAPSFTRR